MAGSSPSTPSGSYAAGDDEHIQNTTGQSSNHGEAADEGPTRRGPSKGIGDHVDGQPRMVIITNDHLQPMEPNEVVKAFSTKLGIIARRDIPIYYSDWRIKELQPFIEEAIKALGKQFRYDYQDSLDSNYTRSKLNDAWRAFKSTLYETHIKGRDPSVVKLSVPKGVTVPLEEWHTFVDMCHSEKFQVSSERNSKNRKQLLFPSCTGRTPASVIRRKIAVDKGIPISQVGRADSYMVMHTKKDKTPQCLELMESINNYISEHPESRSTSANDAIANTIGGDGKGRFRGMGTGVTKTQIKMMEPVFKKHASVVARNFELEKRLENMEQKLEANMIEIRALFAARTSIPDSPSPSSYASRHSVTVDNANIGKECDLRGGCRWPLQVVARGIVQEVNPLTDFGNRKLEEGNFKVFVNVVHDPNVQLPCPHDEYFTTLGHIGQGSVIWPRELLVFNSSVSPC